MTMDLREVARAVERWELRRDGPRARGPSGMVSANAAGASPDFHDHRPYVPGDDVRHVDWAVYGRTRELIVRLYRAEVAPGIDVFVDGSRSMALADGRKEALARELAEFALRAGRRAGERVALWELGEAPAQHEGADTLRFAAGRPNALHDPARWGHHARLGAVHVLISDFLTGEPPAPIVHHLAARAARLVVVQVLGPWEAAPEIGALWTLADAETGAEHTLRVTAEARARYLARVEGVRAELARACAVTHAAFASVVAGSLDEALRGPLLAAGIVA